MSKPATRIGDKDEFHCSQPHRAQGSGDVFVDGIPWSLLGHNNDPHLKPAGNTCVIHQSPIVVGSTSVFVNGRPSGRIGDDVGGADCTTVIQGSQDVFAGG
jgi:uncharacterized Zn-binding protein involved in type VI secretion